MTDPRVAAEASALLLRQQWQARLAIIAAGILWSSSGLFAKLGIFDNWPLEQRGLLLSFWRALFAGLLLWPFVRRPHWRWELLPLGVCFAVMVVSFLSSMTLGTSANAIWLQYTAPCWVLLGSRFLFREPWEPGALSLIMPAILGVGLILFFEVRSLQGPLAIWAVVLGCVSSLAYAGVALFLRHLRGEETTWLVAMNQTFTAICLLPWVIAAQVWPTLEQFVFLAIFGALQMALPYLLFSWGLRHTPSHQATILTLIEPFLVPVWVYLMIGEVPAWWTVVGAMIILAGSALRHYLISRRTQRLLAATHP